MHSTEHILNQTMDRMFQCGRCFNAHIEKKKSKCDYRFDRQLTRQELEEIQTRVNQVIANGLPVTEEHVSRSKALRKYSHRFAGDAVSRKYRGRGPGHAQHGN